MVKPRLHTAYLAALPVMLEHDAEFLLRMTVLLVVFLKDYGNDQIILRCTSDAGCPTAVFVFFKDLFPLVTHPAFVRHINSLLDGIC